MKLLIASILMMISLSSCVHVYYAPNTADAPLLTQKGETRVNALYCSGNDSQFGGGELQAATAITDKFGVMVNGFSAGKSQSVPDDFTTNATHNEKGSGSYLEFAGGYFKALDEKRKCIAEVYSGFGFGTVKNDYGYGDNSKVNCFKFFIQPALGYKVKHFEIAIVPKISFINWRIKENNITSMNNNDVKTDLQAIHDQHSFLAFEPAILMRVGADDIKLQGALSFSSHKSSNIVGYEGLIETLNGSIGLSINIKPLRK